jgi:hypothetical protein
VDTAKSRFCGYCGRRSPETRWWNSAASMRSVSRFAFGQLRLKGTSPPLWNAVLAALAFADPVKQFDAGDGSGCAIIVLESEHGPRTRQCGASRHAVSPRSLSIIGCASPNSIQARNGCDSRTQGSSAKVLRLGSKYFSIMRSDRTKVERPAA